MKKFFAISLLMALVAVTNLKAQSLYASISATSFDDEKGWIMAPGFDYGWNSKAPDANIFSNSRNTVTLRIDGYDPCMGNVKVQLGRLSFTAWDFKDIHSYYSDAVGSEHPLLTAADFVGGRATLQLKLPAGIKPWNVYTDLAAGEFRGWTVQVTGTTTKEQDAKCGGLYINMVMDVTEEIIGSSSVKQIRQAKTISISPNVVKAGEIVKINSRDFTGNVNIKIMNMTGAKVYEGVMSSSNMQFSSAKLAAGIYYAEVKGNGNAAIQKFVVR